MPLSYVLRSGDIVEVLTSKRERGPSRDWLALVKTTRARNKIKAWFKAESRRDTEHTGRELLQEHLRKQGLPAQKLVGSPLLADVIREMGFRKGDDFYIALGGAKISPKVVVNKVMQRLKQGEAAESEPTAADDLLQTNRRRTRPTTSSTRFGISVEGIDEVMLRLAKCCRPVPGDPIVGYISLGRGITIHRDDCPNVAVLKKDPDRFTAVAWDGDAETSFRVEIQVDGWDRHRLLEDMSRTFAEAGINILEAHCTVNHPMVKQPVRRRGGGHAHAGSGDQPPAQHRRGVRRLPRHARRGLIGRFAPARRSDGCARPARSRDGSVRRCRGLASASGRRRVRAAGATAGAAGEHPDPVTSGRGCLANSISSPVASDLISLGWTTGRSICRRVPRTAPARGEGAAHRLGHLPAQLGAGHLRDQRRRVVHVLAVGERHAR